MEKEHSTLTAAEWQVMECLWEKEPRTGREAADWLEERTGWNRSTSLTLLRRLAAKGAVRIAVEDGVKAFYPAIAREDAAVQETEDLLERAYRGSVSLMVSALTKKQSLSKQEIDALHALLDGLEEENHG
jgi:BlaI family penicillinase repressor